MAREQYGLEVNPGPFGIDSRPALIGEQYAKERGLGKACHRAVAEAYWQRAQPIDDPRVLAEIAAQVGIEREAFLAALNWPSSRPQWTPTSPRPAGQRDDRRAGAGVRREVPGDGRPALLGA